MDLKQWCQIDEAIHVAATDEEYKKYAGIDNNEKLIERLAELKLSVGRTGMSYEPFRKIGIS